MNNIIFSGVGKAIVILCLGAIAIIPTYAALMVAGVNIFVAGGVSIIAVLTARITGFFIEKIDECD